MMPEATEEITYPAPDLLKHESGRVRLDTSPSESKFWPRHVAPIHILDSQPKYATSVKRPRRLRLRASH